ncbi:MAG: hypothetical protein D6730_21845 [Bacteroidetes bacterium]|nr:MAG: hypothetical protein D6730_21845 [Bacteroidota bacterium]
MKDFMLIFIGSNYSELGLSPEEMQNRMGKWWEWHAKMEEQGILKGGHALHPEARRVSGAGRSITDRSSTELKELVGGYYIVSAKDVEAATRIAEDYPDYDLGGTVEIREVMVFEQ